MLLIENISRQEKKIYSDHDFIMNNVNIICLKKKIDGCT